MPAKARLPKDPVKSATRLPGTAQDRRDAKGRKVGGTRLRKLECSDRCGYPPMRVSRAAIKLGLPTCVCGAVCWPWDLEDVELAHEHGHLTAEQRASHPLVQAYAAECSSIAHGQAWDGQSSTDHLNDPTAGAYYRVQLAVHQTNQAAKLEAARRQAKPDPIPF